MKNCVYRQLDMSRIIKFDEQLQKSYTVFNEKKILVHTRLGVVQGGCAQTLCAGVVREGCACLCAQRRMVVRGGCAQGCAQWCAQLGCKALCASNGTRVDPCSEQALFERHKVLSLVRILFH